MVCVHTDTHTGTHTVLADTRTRVTRCSNQQLVSTTIRRDQTLLRPEPPM
jgi:hypothetical protein